MLGGEMGESGRSARLGFGEVVEVRGGGHIVRSTSRKDRHSKVSTARGPRDRRVRLAAHTAIQFYDVQDRLGYDRPSKAVDWLITKAKAAIDELERHSALNTTAGSAPVGVGFGRGSAGDEIGEDSLGQQLERRADADLEISDVSGERTAAVLRGGDEHRGLHQNQNRSASDSRARNSSLLPPSLDSDSIADTIRSFFPMDASIETSSSATQFRSLAPPDLPSRSSNHSQDLRLSLQYRDPILLHDHRTENRQQHQNSNPQHSQGQILLSGIPLGFHGTAAWPEHHHHQGAELSHFQRLPSWNSGEGVASASDGAVASAGYTFNSPPASQPLLHLLFGHEHPFFQRGPLQSSNTPAIRAWIDSLPAAGAAAISTELPQPRVLPIYPPSVSGAEFASGYGEFSGFRVPARIQGDEEEHNGYDHKPSSASSDS